jgi:transmembrane sensor
MSPRHHDEPSADEQAVRFLQRLPDADFPNRQALARWLRRSPEHVDAFLRQQMLSTELRGLDPDRTINVDALVERARAANTVVPWPADKAWGSASTASPPSVSQTRHTTASRFGIAAALVLSILGAALWWWIGTATPPQPLVYSTGIGQRQVLPLPDGSKVELNTQSSVQVLFSPTRREIRLLGGEALFEVRHNDAIPFRVRVGSTVIQDVGTRFNVRRAEGLTTVSVLEGSIDVSADHTAHSSQDDETTIPGSTVVVASHDYQRLARDTRVVAGEQLRIVADGTLAQRHKVDVNEATAWREGRLIFSGATLEEVVAEFNRYNARQIILVGDPRRTRRYSGIFDATDPQSFLEYLRKDDAAELVIQNDADGLIIRGSDNHSAPKTP